MLYLKVNIMYIILDNRERPGKQHFNMSIFKYESTKETTCVSTNSGSVSQTVSYKKSTIMEYAMGEKKTPEHS